MKNVRILALAAALSAVMTGSAFATAVPGQHLSIVTTLSRAATTNAVVTSAGYSMDKQGNLPATTQLATITGLPNGAWIVDTNGVNADSIKFLSNDGASHTFAAKVVASDNSTVVSKNTPDSISGNSVITDGKATVLPYGELSGIAPGVYVSTPIVYTFTS
ncbi:TPA: hypothetical protein ACIVK9_005457 [Salmonella enterica subsp. enterica serovar Muenchen]